MATTSQSRRNHFVSTRPSHSNHPVLGVQEALPENTKQPSYRYGTAGCFGYYEAKLNDLRAYEELHSGVLHNFRRLGNGIAALQLLEAALHARATFTALRMPPVGTPQPLVQAATAVATAWGQDPSEMDMVHIAEQLASLSMPIDTCASLIGKSLIAVARAIEPLKGMWLADETPQTDMAGADTSKAFYRVWSAVLFLFCTAPFDSDGGSMENASLFGDGVSIAGCLVLHALGQRHRFELFDFNAHVLAVRVAETSVGELEPAQERYIKRAVAIKRSNDRFFALLESEDAPTIYNVWRCG